MKELDRIYKTLEHCSKELGRCSGLIQAARFNSAENIHRIGTALANLYEIQNEIHKLRPDLIPKKWKKPKSQAQHRSNRRYGALLIETQNLCEQNNPTKAIERLQSFIRSRPGKNFETLALHELKSIRARFKL